MAMMTMDTSERAARAEQFLFTLDEISMALRISRAEVERMIASGMLASVKIKRLRRVTRAQLEAFVRDLERQAGWSA